MKDLTEKSLEDVIIELQRAAAERPIALRPTKIMLKPWIVQAVADRLSITFDEALAHLKRISIGELDVEKLP